MKREQKFTLEIARQGNIIFENVNGYVEQFSKLFAQRCKNFTWN